MEMNRFELIMVIVDAWAEHGAGWDCRDEAVYEVRSILDQAYYAAQMTDEEIAEQAINAWLAAE
jgi:hypothetical protein